LVVGHEHHCGVAEDGGGCGERDVQDGRRLGSEGGEDEDGGRGGAELDLGGRREAEPAGGWRVRRGERNVRVREGAARAPDCARVGEKGEHERDWGEGERRCVSASLVSSFAVSQKGRQGAAVPAPVG